MDLYEAAQNLRNWQASAIERKLVEMLTTFTVPELRVVSVDGCTCKGIAPIGFSVAYWVTIEGARQADDFWSLRWTPPNEMRTIERREYWADRCPHMRGPIDS